MDLEDFYPEFLQGLAGTIIVISFFIPWAKIGKVNIYSFESLAGIALFFIGWLLILCSLINFDAFRSQTLKDLKPLMNALGILEGIFGLVGVAIFYMALPSSTYSHLNWAIYITITGCILGALSSLSLFYLSRTSGRGRRKPRRRSGGL